MSEPESLYAWIGTDETGPHLAAAGLLSPRFAVPMVTTSRDLAEKMQPFAQMHANKTGHAVELMRFGRLGGVLAIAEPQASVRQW